jgi:hypothetical protein
MKPPIDLNFWLTAENPRAATRPVCYGLCPGKFFAGINLVFAVTFKALK